MDEHTKTVLAERLKTLEQDRKKAIPAAEAFRRVLEKPSRKAPVAKFPFVVYYVTNGEIITIACLHEKRNPKILLERIRTLGPSLS